MTKFFIHSVPNRSDHIRFAMDLRYQSPNRPWGFFDKSKGILLRSPFKPDHVPDWEFYSTQGRYDVIKELLVENTVRITLVISNKMDSSVTPTNI